MSGGYYDYKQFQIRQLWEEMQDQLDRQGKEKTPYELTLPADFYEDFPEHKFHIKFSRGVEEFLKETINHLKVAEVYTQYLDWYFSNDIDEHTLYKKLEEDLEKLNLTN